MKTIWQDDNGNNTSDEKYQCGSCEQFFDKPKNNSCPHCGSGNYVMGCIDENSKT